MVRPRNGKWVADVKVGNLPRVRKSFVCKDEAERFEVATRESLKAQDAIVTPPNVTGDTVGKWLPLIAKDIWGDNATDDPNLRNIVRTWVDFLGPATLLNDIRVPRQRLCHRIAVDN
jgi:hypothetical protein